MRVVVITPPAPLVEWEDAQQHLNLQDDDSQQALVEGFVAAASAHIDGPNGWLGRAIGIQTLEARFDGFDVAGQIALPFPPLINVLSVTYLDQTGAPQVAATTLYETIGDTIEPAFGSAWPSTRLGRETVRVRYRCGYVSDPSASSLVPVLPPAIRAAILLMVTDLYENRGTTLDARAAGAAAVPMSTTVENLLAPFRVWR